MARELQRATRTALAQLLDILDLNEGRLGTIATVEHRQNTGAGQECSENKQNAAEVRKLHGG